MNLSEKKFGDHITKVTTNAGRQQSNDVKSNKLMSNKLVLRCDKKRLIRFNSDPSESL